MPEAFGFVKENLSGAQRRKNAGNGERVQEKDAKTLSPHNQKFRACQRSNRMVIRFPVSLIKAVS